MKYVLPLSLAALTCQFATATTVVDFTRNTTGTGTASGTIAYVGSDSDTGSGVLNTNRTQSWNFRNVGEGVGTPLVDGGTANGDSSLKLYGSYTKFVDAASTTRQRFNGSEIQYQIAGTAGSTVIPNLKGNVIWNKADFLNGTSSSQLQLNSLSLGVTLSTWNSGAVKMLVKQGSTYYVSSDTFTTGGASLASPLSFSIANVSSTTWATFDVANYSVTSAFGSQNFNDIDSVGLTFNVTGNPAVVTEFRFNDFQADASIVLVPEPSTFALLGGGLVAIFAMRRPARK